MNNYSDLPEVKHFNSVVEGKANLTYIVRDADLQREALDELAALAERVAEWKSRAVSDGEEDRANLFLGCEFAIDALMSETNMWLQLKAGEPDKAWDSLVNAQMAVRDAIRAHKGFAHLEARAIRLVNIERVVFPEQVFFSAGLIVGRQECSICGAEYGDCPHVIGQPYWGKLCGCVLREVEADHVAIVKEPANKHCRVVCFNTEGGIRNRMTWRVAPGAIQGNPDPDRKGLTASGVILDMTDLDGQRK